MEEAVCIEDYGQGCDGNFDIQTLDQLDSMDFQLASSLLDLDEEDFTEIHRMVDEWEFNFGSIESSDGEELVRLVQIDNPSQFTCFHPMVANGPTERTASNDELHDRLPSYYTALASSRSAPWIAAPSSQPVFNKLPAYITDIAPLDAANVADCGQPAGKKKLNLAEYRTRREKQLQQLQQEEEQQQKQEDTKKDDEEEIRVKVEPDKKSPSGKEMMIKDEPEEGEVEEEEEKNTIVKSRIRSSRSPTRSYSSRSSRSSSASSSYLRSRSRSPSYRRGRRRRRSSRSPSRHRRRRTPTPPPPRCRGYNERHRRQTERQRQIEERRVIYVGKLAEGTTRSDLRHRFEPFGPVVDISLHFRERGDNYGFVTFAYKVDAYEAVEHGNDDPHLPKYDLSFGGRRLFCKETYADLDAVDDDGRSKANDVDFDTLLRAVQVQLHRRPCS